MANQTAMAQDIVQQMLSSVDVVINGRLKELAFDKTIEGQIIEKSAEHACAYRVQYQDSVLVAYAKDTDTFYKGDTVLIHIPQGNFDNQKTILGKKTQDDVPGGVYNFKLPFDDFIGLNRLTPGEGEWLDAQGFRANDPEDGFHLVGTGTPLFEFPNPAASAEEQAKQRRQLEKAIGSSKLGLEVDVQSLLNAEMPISGDYGLKVLITGMTKSSEYGMSEEQTLYGDFVTADMYGNPYNFLVPYTQEKLFDVSNFLNISKIQIYFMQDWNFKASGGVPISYIDPVTEDRLPPNILFSNLNLYLGLTADELTEDKVFLYSYDDTMYSTLEDTKELHVTWVHKMDNGFMAIDTLDETPFHIEDDGEAAFTKYDVEIYWYRKVLNTTNTNKYGGTDWEIINTITEIPHYVGEDENGDPIIEVDTVTNLQDYDLTITPDISHNFDRFKVVVVYNNKAYTCEEHITFQNATDVETLNEALRGNAEIILKCFSLAVDTDGNEVLVEDPWNGNFYIYDENGRSIYDEYGTAFSDKVYYLRLYKRALTGEYYPLQIDSSTGDIQVSWGDEEEWKRRYTMIESFRHVFPEEKMYDKLNDSFMRAFTIADYYNVKNNDNTIIVNVTMDGRSYYVNRELLFGPTGTQGTDYSVTIEIDGNNKGIIVGAPFKLICHIRDRYGKLVEPDENSDITYEWSYLNSAGEIININQLENYFQGTLTNNEPFIVTVTVKGGFSKYPLTVNRGILVCNNADFFNRCDFTLPDRIQFQSNGTSPVYDTSTFEILDLENNENYYPEWYLAKDVFDNLSATSASQRWKKYYVLNSETIGGYSAVVQKIEDGVLTGYERSTSEPIVKYSLAASQLNWTEDMLGPSSFNYIYATLHINDQTIFIGQAIAFSQNTYASSLVNTWNGQSLDINEEDGTIVGRSIAAGTKDSRNRFTGVMMGDWAEHGDDSLEMAGLYGFQQGAQTFGFKRDGSAFIGKAGAGQIQFDGNKAMIANADGTCYINLNPIKITSLEDINLNAVGGSPYFLYSSVDHIASNETRLNKTWASQFLNDSQHDYFVVDPNYGVVTSGTLLSNSGLIGNWEITKFGLMQGYSYPTANNILGDGRYVYLGYSPMSDEEYHTMEAQLTAKYTTLSDALTTKYETDVRPIEAAYNEAKETAQTDYDNGVIKLEEELSTSAQAKIDELNDIANQEADELATLYADYRNALNRLKQQYSADQSALRRKYNEDLQAWAMDNLPALCDLDPQHFLNYAEPLQIMYDCVMDNFLSEDALYKELTDPVRIQNILQTEIASITQDFKHWYAQYHDHYNFNNGQITRQTKISVGQLSIISSMAGIPVGSGRATYEPKTTDRYGTKVLYSQAEGTYVPVDRSRWQTTGSSSVGVTTYRIQAFYDLQGTNALPTSVPVPTFIYPEGNDQNAYTLPWTRERLEVFAEAAVVALQTVSDGYNKQLQYMIDAAGSSIDPDVMAALYQKLLEDLARLQAEYEAACASVPRVSDEIVKALHDRYDALRAEVEQKYRKMVDHADLARKQEMDRLNSILTDTLAAAKKTYESAFASIDRNYQAEQKDLDSKFGEAIANIYKYDNNKYAIYIGCHSVYDTIAQGYRDEVPLFSVRWDGAMQARKGLIGNNSPWVISDDGIAQTVLEDNNNLTNPKFFGTIYLGNPVVDTDFASNWTEETDYRTYNDYVGVLDNDNKEINPYQQGGEIWAEKKYTLHNPVDQKDYKVRDRIEYLGLAHFVDGQWTRANSNARLIRYLDNSEQFCFYAGTDHINLGLRVDGYLFSQYGQIAGWFIEPSRLIKYDANDKIAIALTTKTNGDDFNGLILNNYNIILDGDSGVVKIGTNTTQGQISISGYYIDGGAQNNVQFNINGTVDEGKDAAFDLGSAIQDFEGAFQVPYNFLSVTQTQQLDGVQLSIYVKPEGDYADIPAHGIDIVSPTKINDEPVTTANSSVLFMPRQLDTTFTTMGTLYNWNFNGGNIFAKNIYVGEGATRDIVATQSWVAHNALLGLSDRINSMLDSIAAALKKANGAAGSAGAAANLANGALSQLGDLMAGLTYVTDVEYNGGKFTFKYVQYAATDEAVDINEDDTSGFVYKNGVKFSKNADGTLGGEEGFQIFGRMLPYKTGDSTFTTQKQIETRFWDMSYDGSKLIAKRGEASTTSTTNLELTLDASTINYATDVSIKTQISKLQAKLDTLITLYKAHTHTSQDTFSSSTTKVLKDFTGSGGDTTQSYTVSNAGASVGSVTVRATETSVLSSGSLSKKATTVPSNADSISTMQ